MRTPSLTQLLFSLLIAALLAPAGCDDRASPVTTPDSGTTPAPDLATQDSRLPAPEAALPVAWNFIPDDDGIKQQVIALKLEEILEGRATLSLVARGVSAIQGVAFRLAFSPDRVEVDETVEGSFWDLPALKKVTRFATRPEGEVWGGMGFIGRNAVPAQQERELARITLTLKGREPIPIAFRPHHNLVMDIEGNPIPVSWLGGKFETRLGP